MGYTRRRGFRNISLGFTSNLAFAFIAGASIASWLSQPYSGFHDTSGFRNDIWGFMSTMAHAAFCFSSSMISSIFASSVIIHGDT